MTQTTELFLIRHGQPVLKNALLGSTDSALSELGWLQLEKTVQSLDKIDHIISSPLNRCAAFAQQYASDKSLALLIDKEWRECFFGDWDGKTYQSLYQEVPSQMDAFFSDPDKNTPPNAETLFDFNQRINNALMSVLEKFKAQRVVVFTHAGVIRTLVAWCLKMDYTAGYQFKRFAVDYASVTHLSIFHGEQEGAEKYFPQLMMLNYSSKLKHPSPQPSPRGRGGYSPLLLEGEGCLRAPIFARERSKC